MITQSNSVTHIDSRKLTVTYPVLSHEVDPHGALRIDALAGLLHDSAWRHAEATGIGFNFLKAHKLLWVIARFKIQYIHSASRGENIQVQTWPRCADRVSSSRDFVVTDMKNKPLALASGQWLIMDYDTRKPVRITRFHRFFDFHDQAVFPDRLQKLPISKEPVFTSRQTVTWQHLDFNFHVNNLNYIRWGLDALSASYLNHHRVIDFEVNYLAESRLGDNIIIHVNKGLNPDTYGIYFYRESDNKELVRIRLQFTPKKY